MTAVAGVVEWQGKEVGCESRAVHNDHKADAEFPYCGSCDGDEGLLVHEHLQRLDRLYTNQRTYYSLVGAKQQGQRGCSWS